MNDGLGDATVDLRTGTRLVEVKVAGIQRNGSGPGICSLEVVLAEGR
jgi:hypothetical protein